MNGYSLIKKNGTKTTLVPSRKTRKSSRIERKNSEKKNKIERKKKVSCLARVGEVRRAMFSQRKPIFVFMYKKDFWSLTITICLYLVCSISFTKI